LFQENKQWLEKIKLFYFENIKMKIIFFANTDWYLYNFRLALAKRMRELGNTVVMVSKYGPYTSKLIKEGFKWYSVELDRRSLNPFKEIKLLFQLIKIFRKEKAEFSHNFTIKCVIYGTIASKLTGIQGCINAITGLGYVFSNDGKLPKILKPIIQTALNLIAYFENSRIIVQNYEDSLIFESLSERNKNSVRLIKSSGVDVNRFSPTNRTKTDNDKKYCNVLLATRLIWDKGIKEYIEAAKLCKNNKDIDINCFLAGSPDYGNPNSVTKEDIQLWSNLKYISYLGHVENIENVLAEMDIVVLPTTYGEGIPRILLEAAASGLPIIATNIPGCKDIVDHLKNGLLIEPHDYKDLAKKIIYLAKNSDERARMGLCGRQIVEKEFNENIIIRETLSVYSELLQK
jgi:glycosyltransferase involved in cell wall biosynthesis